MRVGLNPGFLFALYADKVFFNEMIDAANKAVELGFDSLRLEVYCDSEYAAFTKENTKALRKHFESLGLISNYFVACAPRDKLATLDKAVREEGLRDFERTVEIAYDFGLCDDVALVSGAPKESNVKFLDTYPGAPPAMLLLPANITWSQVWETYLDTINKCLDMCRKRGLTMSVEPLPMTVMNNTDCYLNLANAINSKDLGVMIDASHLHYQRESLPTSIEKVKGQLRSFCVCDNNGLEDYHLAPGQGTIDWKECIKTLKKIGFDGTLDLEINVPEDPMKTYADAKVYLEKILKEVQ